jgi:alkanesulfonate monooxygenase SsuD/methylene tetrahydromethanopterin reductase-like flavin-dependent oxidoreductase (luciferase family)
VGRGEEVRGIIGEVREGAMKFGILVTPGAHVASQVVKAERHGFESAFFVDSPMIFGDPYVSMGAVAAQTRTIMLATGVTNPLTRSAPVTAASIAALNAIAPGRIALGIGVGFTANRAMGQRNGTLDELERYVRDIRQLLRGQVAEVALTGREVPVQFLNPGKPWINLDDPIPIHIAAAGPRALVLAGEIADAIILGGITDGEVIAACRRYIEEGARRRGRRAEEIELSITPSVYVTDHEPTQEHLREVLGPKSLAPAMMFSRVAEASGTVRKELVEEFVRARAAAYEPEEGAARTRHLKAYRGYMTALKPWQYPLVTDNVLETTSIAGTVEQCCAKIRRLEEAGIARIILSPLPQYVEATIEIYGSEILPRCGVKPTSERQTA